jgi:hypothetical protein
MQTRRQFLSSTVAVLILVPACASSSSGTSSGADGGTKGCDGVSSTSTVALGHTHTVCVPQSDLSNPPEEGATYTTSPPMPMHTITLTAAQLASIEAGQTVTVTTSTNANHNHMFSITKSA